MVKNKARRQFQQNYKWWDYSYLLLAMRDWLIHAAKMTDKRGITLNGPKYARRMRVAAALCDRILQDDYGDKTAIFPKVYCDFEHGFANRTYYPDEATYQKYMTIHYKHRETQKQRDIEYLMWYIGKHLQTWWD